MGVFGSAPPWWLGGLIFGAVAVALRLVLNERLGVLGGYSELVERASGRARALGWKSFFLIGVIGGVLYALVSGRWANSHRYGWLARDFPDHVGLATGLALTLAGVLIGFGAKTAGGCTSGNGFGGTTSGSPASSWRRPPSSRRRSVCRFCCGGCSGEGAALGARARNSLRLHDRLERDERPAGNPATSRRSSGPRTRRCGSRFALVKPRNLDYAQASNPSLP